jgi:hypothetical protein
MVANAFIFSLITLAITMAVSMAVAAIIKLIGAFVRTREKKAGTTGAKS